MACASDACICVCVCFPAFQDLAWSSVSLIKNTNSCGVIVVHDGQVVMARGALGSSVVNKDPQATISAVTQVRDVCVP